MSEGWTPQRRTPLQSLRTAAPLVVYVVLLVVLYLMQLSIVWEPPLLLPALNTIAFVVVALVAGSLAVYGFRQGGTMMLLLLGAGIVVFGLSTVVGTVLLSYEGANAGVTRLRATAG